MIYIAIIYITAISFIIYKKKRYDQIISEYAKFILHYHGACGCNECEKSKEDFYKKYPDLKN
jgi:hypothetical protein